MQGDLERGLEGASALLGAWLFSNQCSGSLILEVITSGVLSYSSDEESLMLLCRGVHNLSPEHAQPCTMAHGLVNTTGSISASLYDLCFYFCTRHGLHTDT